MDQTNLKLAAQIIDKSYVDLGSNSLNSRENMIKVLLSQRSLPDEGLNLIYINYKE